MERFIFVIESFIMWFSVVEIALQENVCPVRARFVLMTLVERTGSWRRVQIRVRSQLDGR